MSTRSINQQKYRVDVYRQQNNKWSSIYSKAVDNAMDSISKMAGMQAVHMFCFTNSEEEHILKVGVEFMSGLELGELNELPSTGDHNLLDQNIEWLETQKKKLISILERANGA